MIGNRCNFVWRKQVGVKNCRYGEGRGNGEQGTEKRFRATLLFVTYFGFFPFFFLHLLSHASYQKSNGNPIVIIINNDDAGKYS